MRRRGWLGACAATLVLAAPAFGAASERDPRTLPLIDQTGARFDLMRLRGRPVLLTFISTRCTDTCPLVDGLFSHMAAQKTKPGARALDFVTLTLDPVYDTPFVMSQRAVVLGAKAPRWRYASGNAESLKALAASLGVSVRPDDRGVPEDHTSFVYLIDRRGRLARSFLLSDHLASDVGNALAKMN